MSEVTDPIMPILQKIQQDIVDMRRGLEARIGGVDAKASDITERQLEHGKKIDELRHYMTLHMGVTMQHSLEFSELKSRVTVLEQAP